MYGTKLRYGLKPKIITYEDHPKNGNKLIRVTTHKKIVNPLRFALPPSFGVKAKTATLESKTTNNDLGRHA
jgi:hypothetical protein